MLRATVTVNFKDPRVTQATMYFRRRTKKAGPPQDPAQNIPGENHPMMGKAGTFTAMAVPLPNPGANKKLLIRVIGYDAMGNQLVVLDAPPRNHPPKVGKKAAKKEVKKK